MSTVAATKIKLCEVFGPTVQGEGPLAGTPTHFIRIGGCDYLCSWCDSLYAVLPQDVRKLPSETVSGILSEVLALEQGPRWVTISGGNPALYNLHDLVAELHREGYRVAVETQGSRFKPWLLEVDMLVVSPKPPSSGMDTAKHAEETERFFYEAQQMADRHGAIKVVVFDKADYDYARRMFMRYPEWAHFASAGTPQGAEDAPTKEEILGRYAWLCEHVSCDPAMWNVRVLPQLHVLAWGTRRGV